MSSSAHHRLPRRQPPRVLPRRGGQRGRRSQKRRRPHLGPPSGPRPRPIPKWDMWTDARTALLTSSAITYRRGQTAGTGRPWNGAERELALAQCPSRIPGAETIPKGSFRNCGVPHIPRPAGPGVSKRRGEYLLLLIIAAFGYSTLPTLEVTVMQPRRLPTMLIPLLRRRHETAGFCLGRVATRGCAAARTERANAPLPTRDPRCC